MEKNIIFKCLTGSRAYGTDVPESDYDYKGVYIQNKDELSGFNYQPQIQIGKDETYYELRRFLELACSANPTILEMMYTNPMVSSPVWEELLKHKSKFLTKKCLNSFGGYAVQQIVKAKGLNKKMNWEKEKTVRKTPIDFCTVFDDSNGQSKPLTRFMKEEGLRQEYIGLASIDKMPNCYAIFYDWSAEYGKELNKPIAPLGFRGVAFETSNDIRLSSIPKEQHCEGILYYNKDAYSKHCKEYNEYEEWLKNRNVTRYVDVQNHNQKIDGKNLMHCVRLLDMCEEIAKENTIHVHRPNAEQLLNIRRGNVDLNTIIEHCEYKLEELKGIYKNSNLPEDIDKKELNTLLLNLRQLYENG